MMCCRPRVSVSVSHLSHFFVVVYSSHRCAGDDDAALNVVPHRQASTFLLNSLNMKMKKRMKVMTPVANRMSTPLAILITHPSEISQFKSKERMAEPEQ